MEKAVLKPTDKFMTVRLSLLTNGKTQGGKMVRVGTEEEPVVGIRSVWRMWDFDFLRF